MADWESLHSDILVQIVKKIKLIEDFAAFSLVCKSWSAARNKQYLRRPQIPWLVLPEKKDDHRRHIYSVSKESILTRNLYIPEMSGNKRCIGLNYGWVLTISEEGDMNLVHPLSRSQIELPPQTSIVDYEKLQCAPPQIFTRKAALSGNPSESDDFVVMIIHSGGQHLGYWRAGDKSWTRIEKRLRLWWTDLIYYDNQFYAITNRGLVWSCKVHEVTSVRVVTQISSRLIPSGNVPYIVGLAAGVLLVVVREEKEEHFEDSNEMSEYGWNWGVVNYWVSGFQLYELDLIKGSHNQIKCLGDRAIFVGLNTSVLLDRGSEYPGIKPNSIYFTDDRDETYSCIKEGGGKDMGSYNLEDGQTTPFKVEESLSRINTPFWFIPSLYVQAYFLCALLLVRSLV